MAVAGLLLAGCGALDSRVSVAEDGPALPALAPPADAVMTTPFGAYLSGRVAQAERDVPAALAFYLDTLAHDPGNVDLERQILVLALTEGRFDIATPLADRLTRQTQPGGLPDLVQLVEAMKAGRLDAAREATPHLPSDGFAGYIASLARAWVAAAGKGGTAAALAALDGLDRPELAPLKALHRALIEDLAGDDAAAFVDYQAALATPHPALRQVQLAGNFEERSGRKDEAAKLYAGIGDVLDREAGLPIPTASASVPPRLVRDPKDGLAEALFDIASLVNSGDATDVAVLNLRLALELRPDFPLAELILGDVLETQGRLPAALAAYRGIDPASPFAWMARLREAAVTEQTGDHTAAATLLRAMAAERPQSPEPLILLGDDLRAREAYGEAAKAYDEALARIGGAPQERYWSLYFTRGVTEERSGDWQAGEKDLRLALRLKPDEAEILNYLGYSLVDRNERLDEAVKLIRQAVDLKPDDGDFVDSLGWAYYRQGHYRDAAATLEHAVELRPADPEINDHLGDAYWLGGKAEDARLQWRRALSLKPDATLARTIEAKLERPAAAAPHPGRGI
jgi:Flp pilus assembly protein TadD